MTSASSSIHAINSLLPGTNLSKITFAHIPSGAPPNFVNPPSLQHAFLTVGVTLIVISWLAMSLRIFANVKHTGKLGFDDGSVGYWAVVYSLVREGTARHSWDVPISAMLTESFMKRQFAQRLITGPTMWAVKSAILALYVRIFKSIRWMRLTSYGLIILFGLFYMSNLVVAAVNCLPRKGEGWDQTTLVRCGSPVTLSIAIGVFGVLADVIVFILPFPIILKLHITRRKRVGVVVVFAAAFLTVVTSVVSLVYRIIVFRGRDEIWNGLNATLAICAENFGTVIVSCAPALSFWRNVVTQSRLYLCLRSKFLSRSSRSGECRKDPELRWYGSEENLHPDHISGISA